MMIISGYTDKQNNDVTDKKLRNTGFDPPDNVTWRSFPATKKLEIAWSAAEKAEPTIGGSKLLARLANDLAIRYEAVNVEPVLLEFFNKEVSLSDIRFAPLKSESPLVELPLEVRKAIKTIANYYYGGPLGNPYIILSKDFKLQDALIDRILEESRTHREIFERAFEMVPDQEKIPTINRLTVGILKNYKTVLHESHLKPFFIEGFTRFNGSERKFFHSFYEHEKNFYPEEFGKTNIPKLSNPFNPYWTKDLFLSFIKQKIPEYNGQIHPSFCNGNLTAIEEKWFHLYHMLITSEQLTDQERILLAVEQKNLLFEHFKQLDSYRETLKTNDGELLTQLEKCSRTEILDLLNKFKNLQLERVKLEAEIEKVNRSKNTKNAILKDLLKISKSNKPLGQNQIKAETEFERMLREGKSIPEIMRELKIVLKR